MNIYTYTTTLRVIRRLGEGREDPKRVRITKRKTMQKTPRRIVLKSNRSMESNVFCCGNLCQSIWNSKCMGMCVHVHLCAHGDFVLPLLLSTCPPLMPSLLHLGCRSMSLAKPGGCDIAIYLPRERHTHTQTNKNQQHGHTIRSLFASVLPVPCDPMH